jgi:hypothetical protein
MGQANVVTQRLFSLMDTISNTKFSVSHESCEIQRKKVLQDLVAAQQQIQILNQQWTEHILVGVAKINQTLLKTSLGIDPLFYSSFFDLSIFSRVLRGRLGIRGILLAYLNAK